MYIFSYFYCLCIISVPHHSPTMDFTHIQTMLKPFKTKILIFSQFYSIKFYVHTTTYLHQMKMFSKVNNTHKKI